MLLGPPQIRGGRSGLCRRSMQPRFLNVRRQLQGHHRKGDVMARLLQTTGFLMILALGLSSSPVAPAKSPKAKSIEAAGTLVPSDSRLVYPIIEGVVKAWHCKSGVEVRKGQKIATVASADVERRLGQFKSEIQAT